MMDRIRSETCRSDF